MMQRRDLNRPKHRLSGGRLDARLKVAGSSLMSLSTIAKAPTHRDKIAAAAIMSEDDFGLGG